MGDVKIDYAALWDEVGKVARGPIEELANQIAGRVDVGNVTEAPVKVMMSTTRKGWPVALVTIAHPAGLAIQAKHGALTKAAAAVGLEVKAK